MNKNNIRATENIPNNTTPQDFTDNDTCKVPI